MCEADFDGFCRGLGSNDVIYNSERDTEWQVML